jgi:serine/threonine-protein kinase
MVRYLEPSAAPEVDDVTTYQEILADGERLPLERALTLVQAAALAVDALHTHQAVHGSLSPAAFQVDAEDRVTLRRLPEEHHAGQGADPARAYWSPQRQAGEPARPADDLYALGLVAEALLTGRVPPADPSPALAMPERTLPPEIEAVLQAQRSWAPSERFASGVELAQELSRAATRAARPSPPLPVGAGWGAGSPPPARAVAEPSSAAARRVAQARAAHRLALAELPDRGLRERFQPVRTAHHSIQHRDYPDFPLPGGWVVALVVVLCSVYLFPLYYMLFPHG